MSIPTAKGLLRPLCAADVHVLRHDAATFFSALPLDALALACQFTFRSEPRVQPERGLRLVQTFQCPLPEITALSARKLPDRGSRWVSWISRNQPPGVTSFCLDGSGNLVVVDTLRYYPDSEAYGRGAVTVYSRADAAVLLEVGRLQHCSPVACTVGRNGAFYVLDQGKWGVSVFHANGAFSHDIGNHKLKRPSDLVLSLDESIVYVISQCDGCIKACSTAADGDPLLDIGAADGKDCSYTGICVFSDGRLACSICPGAGCCGVIVFNGDGSRVGFVTYAPTEYPHCIAADAGNNLYVACHYGCAVVLCDRRVCAPSVVDEQKYGSRVYKGVALSRNGEVVMCPYPDQNTFKVYSSSSDTEMLMRPLTASAPQQEIQRRHEMQRKK